MFVRSNSSGFYVKKAKIRSTFSFSLNNYFVAEIEKLQYGLQLS